MLRDLKSFFGLLQGMTLSAAEHAAVKAAILSGSASKRPAVADVPGALRALRGIRMTNHEHAQTKAAILASSDRADDGMTGREAMRLHLQVFTREYVPLAHAPLTAPAFAFARSANLFRHLEPFVV